MRPEEARRLASDSLAAVLAAAVPPAFAQSDAAAIEAAVPVPEPADVKPPTAASPTASRRMAAIAINIIFNFLGASNDLFTPMILIQKMEKRTVMVALTPEGLAQFEGLAAEHEAEVDRLFSTLTEAEIDTLTAILKRMGGAQ